jgi:hypothetical protein
MGGLSAAQKKKYSHIGRIEETSAGVKDPEDLRVLYKEEVHMPQVPTIIFSE